MLDLSHPQSEHIFAAAKLEDAVLELVTRIVQAEPSAHQVWSASCDDVLADMRRLNTEHFDNSPFITSAIDQLQMAIRATMESADPGSEATQRALALLQSEQGIGTMWI